MSVQQSLDYPSSQRAIFIFLMTKAKSGLLCATAFFCAASSSSSISLSFASFCVLFLFVEGIAASYGTSRRPVPTGGDVEGRRNSCGVIGGIFERSNLHTGNFIINMLSGCSKDAGQVNCTPYYAFHQLVFGQRPL